jgi:hypothetical protein
VCQLVKAYNRVGSGTIRMMVESAGKDLGRHSGLKDLLDDGVRASLAASL